MKKVKLISVIMLLLISGCAPAVIGGAAVGGVVAAQKRTVGQTIDDTTILAKIKNNYLQQNIDQLTVNVNVGVYRGTVLLTGIVANKDTSNLAEELASKVEGVHKVINEITIGTYGPKDYAKDTSITTQVKTRMVGSKKVHSVNYQIETVKSVVYLLGTATTSEELDNATDIARTTKGVVKVVNYLKVAGQ